MNTLVTGGAGLIGSHLADLLLDEGYKVRIFDNLEPTVHLKGKPNWLPKEAEFFKGDMRNHEDLEKALQGVNIIFHQAAYGGFAPEISKMVDVNSLGLAKMFEIIRKNKLDIKKVITASSQAIYGEGKYECPNHGVFHPSLRPLTQLMKAQWEVKCPVCGADMRGLPVDEEMAPDVTGVYSITKYSQERLTLALGKELSIPSVGLRYSLTYGPRQSIFNAYSGICSIFSTRLLNNLPPVIYEDGKQTRDFIYVKDVAKANLLVAEDDRANYNVYNVGTGKATTILDFVNILSKNFNKQIEPIIPKEFRPIDLRHLYADNTKIKNLGFNPRYSLEDGLREYIDWINTQSSPKEYFSEAEKYLKELKVIRKAEI